MGQVNYVKHESTSLREVGVDEAWLQQVIADDPSILGLGDVEVLARERRQHKAGRLDLLLADPSGQQRYEVELMLGATDGDHIIRCIEYWDIERRRYPAYDHTAVLVAENLTGRFLNVLGLFSGTMPLIVLQLDVLKVEGKTVLNFVRVFDRTDLRRDDETPTRESAPVDRSHWVSYSGEANMGICDAILAMINDKASRQREHVYRKQHVGLSDGRRTNNFVWFAPQKRLVWVGFTVRENDKWKKELEDAGLPAVTTGDGVGMHLSVESVKANEAVIRRLAHKAIEEDEE